MNKFKYCPVIEIGDVFTRIDRNGKVWEAKVINRTEYFVDIKKTQPYKIKVADDGIRGQLGCWHWEDTEPTTERCMITRKYEEIEDGKVEETGLYGKYMKKIYKKVPTPYYFIEVKEDYSKHSKYDRTYKLKKYGDGCEENKETVEKSLDKWFNFCDNNKFE